MFGFLKKAVGNFIEKVTGKEEEKKKTEEKPAAGVQEEREEAKPKPQPQLPTPAEEEKPSPKAESVEEEIVREAEREIALEKTVEEPAETPEIAIAAKPKLQPPSEAMEQREKTFAPQKREPVEVKPTEKAKPVEAIEIKPEAVEAKPSAEPVRKPVFELKEEKRDFAPKVGFLKKITGLFTGNVSIGEGEVGPLFDDLRIALLESDVSLDTTEFLIVDLRKRLVGKQVARGGVNDAVKGEVRNALMDLFTSEKDILLEAVAKPKPIKILFIGPNGAGKTTTIAKIAFLLKQKGFTSVIAASDTFRAAAIEQASLHGDKLGIRVIKHRYGADPAAVAFDAIAHAKAEKIDFVLIDTAGRQETNYNLVKEMEKINRVIEPDYKIFVGESIAGHALVEQAKKFHEAVRLDGLVLTKLDADAKGGTAFSIAHDLGIPILFIGVGQEYADLKPFKREWLVENVLS